MKESKLEDIMPVEAIEQRIWKIFNILRSEAIPSDDYYFVLFLLSLYKDGIISNKILSDQFDPHNKLNKLISGSDHEDLQYYLPIYGSFEATIRSISSKGLIEIIEMLTNADKKVLSENFSYIFDKVLYRISESQGRRGGEFIQPVGLTRFICGLAELKNNSKVFNPFAGVASFGVFLDQGQNYLGQEINPKTWALGALRIRAYERPGASEYVCTDSILNWPEPSEKFDLIIANPPYVVGLGNQNHFVESGIRTIEQFFIQKGVDSLSSKGQLIILLKFRMLKTLGFRA